MKQFIYFDRKHYDSLTAGGKVAYKNKVRKSGNDRYKQDIDLGKAVAGLTPQQKDSITDGFTQFADKLLVR